MIKFRPLSTDDLPMLHEWVTRPHVAEWWGSPVTPADLASEYAPLIAGEGPHRAWIAYEDDEPIGFIQSYLVTACHDEGWWLDEHDPGAHGIDQFLADGGRLGAGLGTRMIRAFVARLAQDAAVTVIQTDPSPDNGRAIRCYEKCGFRAAGAVETPDGPALLMRLRCSQPPSHAGSS